MFAVGIHILDNFKHTFLILPSISGNCIPDLIVWPAFKHIYSFINCFGFKKQPPFYNTEKNTFYTNLILDKK